MAFKPLMRVQKPLLKNIEVAAFRRFKSSPLLVHNFTWIRNHPYLENQICSPPVVAGNSFHGNWNAAEHDNLTKLNIMHHGFRSLDRKEHGAGDLEMDDGKQTMPGITCALWSNLNRLPPRNWISKIWDYFL